MGFTKFDNNFLTGLLSLGLNGCEHAVILTILRHTLGFNRENYTFSYTFLEKVTGKSKSSVRRAIKNLIEIDMVREVVPPTIQSPRVLSLNLGFFDEAKREEIAPSCGVGEDLESCCPVTEADEVHIMENEACGGNVDPDDEACGGNSDGDFCDMTEEAAHGEAEAEKVGSAPSDFKDDSFERFWFGDDYAEKVSGGDYSYDDFLRVCHNEEAAKPSQKPRGASLADFGVNLKSEAKSSENTGDCGTVGDKISSKSSADKVSANEKKQDGKASANEEKRGYGRFKNVMLTQNEYGQLFREFGPRVDGLINDFSVKLEAKGYNYKNHYAALLLWEAENRTGTRLGTPGETLNKPEPSPSGFDPEEFFQIALADSFRR